MNATLQTAAALFLASQSVQAAPTADERPKQQPYHLQSYTVVDGVVMTLAEYREYMEGQR